MPALTFRTMYKLKGKKGLTVYSNNLSASTVSELLQSMQKDIGITSLTAQELVIHWIRPDGSVMEVLDFDANKGHTAFTYFEPSALPKGKGNVVQLHEAKPRVRLALVEKETPLTTTACYGRYTIREAR